MDTYATMWYEQLMVVDVATGKTKVILRTKRRGRIRFLTWLPQSNTTLVYSKPAYGGPNELRTVNTKHPFVSKTFLADAGRWRHLLKYDNYLLYEQKGPATSYDRSKTYTIIFDMRTCKKKKLALGGEGEWVIGIVNLVPKAQPQM